MLQGFISSVAVALVSASVAYGTQEASRPADAADPRASTITLTGCVARSDDGKGFVLRQRAAESGTITSPQTSSDAGTSATGAAPSGSVTGSTPTGTTATETAVPTPPVGEPEGAANPASPVFNRGKGGIGTSGTVGRADTADAAIASGSYGLRAFKPVDLAAHLGHTVEVTGVLAPSAGASAGVAAASAASGSAAVREDNLPVLTIRTLTDRDARCAR